MDGTGNTGSTESMENTAGTKMQSMRRARTADWSLRNTLRHGPGQKFPTAS